MAVRGGRVAKEGATRERAGGGGKRKIGAEERRDEADEKEGNE